MRIRLAALAVSWLAIAQASANDTEWRQCLQRLQAQATAAGVSTETWQRHAAELTPRPELLESLNNQPEFTMRSWDYLAVLVDDERIADGRNALQSQTAALQLAQERYGVDPYTVTAVWGVESNYGQRTGGRPILQSLGTLSCMGRRQAFFQKEFFAALRIVQAGDFDAAEFKGSWAGAFGQTQFMPTTFEALAVDLDGDGKRNLISNDADALGSTAHFLKDAGWRPALPWGFEVRVPQNYDGPRGRRTYRAASRWADDGFKRIDAGALVSDRIARDTPLALVQPEPDGPAFLVTRNFQAIYRYNASENYALAIAHLADRLRGQGPWSTPWPTDDAGLSRAERREVQLLLTLRGHDIGPVDGALGQKSRAAIRAEQERLGHAVNGRAGQKLLAALRQTSSGNQASRPPQ